MKTLLRLTAAFALSASCAHADDRPPFPQPIASEDFRETLVRVGSELYISGQPSEQGLRDLKRRGVTTVVNLRTTQEMANRDAVPFDEAAVLAALGMRYVHIPSGGPDTPYSAAMLETFARIIENADGAVLLHCTVAWRASHLYSAYLYRHRGLSLDDAVAHGRAVNLGRLPLEGFLGATLRFDLSENEPAK